MCWTQETIADSVSQAQNQIFLGGQFLGKLLKFMIDRTIATLRWNKENIERVTKRYDVRLYKIWGS